MENDEWVVTIIDELYEKYSGLIDEMYEDVRRRTPSGEPDSQDQ